MRELAVWSAPVSFAGGKSPLSSSQLLLFVSCVGLMLSLIACGGDDSGETSFTPTASSLLTPLPGPTLGQPAPPGLRSWSKTPSVVVVTSKADDPRVPLAADAVDFWNQMLAEVGSPFRIGPIRQTTGTIPESKLREISQTVLNGGIPIEAQELTKDYPDDIVVFMAQGSFISYMAGYVGRGHTMVAIRGENTFPCNLPNVCRNVIAHELGHAIGLLHNSDPALLMCGRPATCTPDIFAAPTPKYFPLSDAEKARLLQLYPKDWTPR